MFNVEEMKAMEMAAHEVKENDIEAANVICNAMSSGCTWG
jgi:hypothetical protein